MKTKPIIVVTFTIIAMVAISCKKYDDGPTFSLASKKGRVEGVWKYEKVTISTGSNTLDITASSTVYTSSMEFFKDGTAKFYNASFGTSSTGTWALDRKKELFIITLNTVSTPYKILRLKEKEFWFVTSASGGVNDTEFHLIPA